MGEHRASGTNHVVAGLRFAIDREGRLYRTGPGPYRVVRDIELRDIVFLTPQSGRAFALRVSTGDVHGSRRPEVAVLLRHMLSALADSRTQRDALMREIATKLPHRNDIVIRGRLLSLCRRAQEEPWHFPALVGTPALRSFHKELKALVDTSDTVANAGSDPFTSVPIGYAIAQLTTKAIGFGYTLATYFADRGKNYYEFYLRRIELELALRGIPASTL